MELGTATRPIPRGRQITSACRRTVPAILVAAFRDSIQENLDLPLGCAAALLGGASTEANISIREP